MNEEIDARFFRLFRVQLSATRRGARLARLLAAEHIRAWGLPTLLDAAEHVIAELAANAASHGRVPGRDFRLRVAAGPGTLRIEVTDARGERAPVRQPPGRGESGRGLVLVDALADRWGTVYGPAPCKTVWAEFDLPPCAGTDEHGPARPV
ncbi:ATP-binding protein [Streptomyces sclerotialus]|uniref:ATP-binding protein n=1 Tax=Streptomyces sclerotialus TaxID=1957 RepID=UPI00068C4ADC